MHLNSFNTITNDGSKFITTFNINRRKKIYYIYICVYRVHSCSISTFMNNLEPIIQKSLEHCPIIIMGDFNIDILKNKTKK